MVHICKYLGWSFIDIDYIDIEILKDVALKCVEMIQAEKKAMENSVKKVRRR
ncbi:MAG: hypothetical protein F6K34_01115 [Okeania sp. SIO4D6]|nr:hypothetical protein [Okeania sp. SIO4D6]